MKLHPLFRFLPEDNAVRLMMLDLMGMPENYAVGLTEGVLVQHKNGTLIGRNGKHMTLRAGLRLATSTSGRHLTRLERVIVRHVVAQAVEARLRQAVMADIPEPVVENQQGFNPPIKPLYPHPDHAMFAKIYEEQLRNAYPLHVGVLGPDPKITSSPPKTLA